MCPGVDPILTHAAFQRSDFFLSKDRQDQHAGGLEPPWACDELCNQLGFKFSLLSGSFLRGSPLSFRILQVPWEDGIVPQRARGPHLGCT